MRAYREVKTFAAAMLRTLNLPRHREKGRIHEVPLHVYRKHYEEERREVVAEVDRFYHCGNDKEAQIAALKRIEEESVDCGNTAMLLHSEAQRLRAELEAG